MDNRHDEYDDDVFSLEEDLVRERRKQLIQYLLVAICAVGVIALALYGSVVLTNNRLENAKNNIVTPPIVSIEPVEASDMNYWPGANFAMVPVFTASEYQTKEQDNSAVVSVPTTDVSGFPAYVETLIDAGAKARVWTEKLSVLDLNGIEIHVVSSGVRHEIAMYNEPAYAWSDAAYTAFPTPDVGKLVAVAEGIGVGSRILTYRNATPIDALNYVSKLTNDGWTMSGAMEPSDNIFLATLKKNNLQIRVDYYSSDDEYQVKFDFLN